MPNVLPQSQAPKSGGILFVNEPGVANFRALRVDVGNQHLYWQPTYQHLLRVEGAFGEFFPQAEFSDNGNRVVFTKHIEGVEVLGKTRALRPGERIPRREWLRFLTTWQSFKRLSERTDIPEDFRNFIIKFGPPSVERYPAAYRIYRPHWYSRPRLFILWGLEPVGGADFISLSPDQAISEFGARVESDRDEANGQLMLWLKAFGLFVLTCLALLLVTWVCLPRPVVDFELKAQATVPTHPKNLSGFDQEWVWGETAYAWTFDRGQPDTSNEKEPQVLWSQPGLRDATLQVTQSTLWGLLYKTEAKCKSILVQDAPKPPQNIISQDPPVQGDPKDRSGTPHGFGTVDKPSQGGGFDPRPQGGQGVPIPDPLRPSPSGREDDSSNRIAETPPYNPSGPKMDQGDKSLPISPGKSGDSVPRAEDKPMLSDHIDPFKKAEGEEPITGGEGKPGPMKGETRTPGRIEGQLEVIPGKNPAGTEGKPMPVEPSQEGRANEKMTPNGGKPGENTPDKGESAPGGRMTTPGESATKEDQQRPLAPSEIKPSQDNQQRSLNAPKLFIEGEPRIIDVHGSQEFLFLVKNDTDIVIENVSIDNVKVNELNADGRFVKQLKAGSHVIRVTYGSVKSNVHESISMPLLVRAVMRPDNTLGTGTVESHDSGKPNNSPRSQPSDPEPQPKQETPEKIDKKLA